MKRNLLLFIVLLFVSVAVSIPVGNFYSNVLTNYSNGFSTFSIPQDLSNLLNGFPLSFLFLSPFILGIFGHGKKWVFTVVVAMLVLILSFFINLGYFKWSVIFFGAGLLLAVIINYFRNKKLSIKVPYK